MARMRRYLLPVLIVVLPVASGCAGSGEDPSRSRLPPEKRTDVESQPPTQGERATGAPQYPGRRRTDRCSGPVRATDGRGDTRPWVLPEPPGRPPTSPSADLVGFEIRAGRDGVCARWTTAAPAPSGTELELVAHGPPQGSPSGGYESHGHGFNAKLTSDGARVTYGLDRLSSRAPRRLWAHVSRAGRTVSVFVPRRELDRPPANMPDRPPFPYGAFAFEARVISPPDTRGGRDADFWPQEGDGRAGFVGGNLCAPPCRDRRLTEVTARHR